MKLMTDNDCLEFIEGVSPEDLAETEHKLNAATSSPEPGWLAEGLRRGYHRITSMSNKGQPLYRYVWHVNDQNLLYVNGSQFIGQPGQNDDWLWMMGVEMLARANKCRGILFRSQRLGHLVQGKNAGFKVTGVEMIKTLEHAPV